MKYLILLLISFNTFAQSVIVGSGANQVPLNGMLGSMAFERAQNYNTNCHALGSTTGATSVAASGFTAINFQNANRSLGQCSTAIGASTFTAPRTAFYHVCSYIEFASVAYTAGNTASMAMFVNGVQGQSMDYDVVEVAATRILALSGCATQLLNTGDVLTIRASNSRTGGTNTSGTELTGWVSITKIAEI
jgi:hypothetical protein